MTQTTEQRAEAPLPRPASNGPIDPAAASILDATGVRMRLRAIPIELEAVRSWDRCEAVIKDLVHPTVGALQDFIEGLGSRSFREALGPLKAQLDRWSGIFEGVRLLGPEVRQNEHPWLAIELPCEKLRASVRLLESQPPSNGPEHGISFSELHGISHTAVEMMVRVRALPQYRLQRPPTA